MALADPACLGPQTLPFGTQACSLAEGVVRQAGEAIGHTGEVPEDAVEILHGTTVPLSGAGRQGSFVPALRSTA